MTRALLVLHMKMHREETHETNRNCTFAFMPTQAASKKFSGATKYNFTYLLVRATRSLIETVDRGKWRSYIWAEVAWRHR